MQLSAVALSRYSVEYQERVVHPERVVFYVTLGWWSGVLLQWVTALALSASAKMVSRR